MKTQLIGHAGQLADLLSVSPPKGDRWRLLFGGNPGIGKSELARVLAEQICGCKFGYEVLIGRKVSIHHITRFEEEFATSCMYGTGAKIVVINEIDCLPKDSADALLALLDDLPPHRGIIGTTNLAFGALAERMSSRFQRYEVRPPVESEIAALLVEQEGIPAGVARHIAGLSGGNVRGAVRDAEAWKNEHADEPRAPVFVQQSIASLGF